MSLVFTNHTPAVRQHRDAACNKRIGKLLRTMLLLSIFFCTSVTLEAQTMWAQSRTGAASAASQFKVSFNITNGSLHIETFAHHPDYWMQALSHYMAYLRSATLSFTTDRVNWTPFFQFGNSQSTVAYTNFLPPYNQVSNTIQVDNAQIRYIDLYLDNNMKNIKAIKIDFEMWGEICCGNHDWYIGSDTKDIAIPQFTAINTPTVDFATVQNNGVFEPKAIFSYTKTSLGDIDRISNMVINESSPPQDKRLTGYLPVATSGSNQLPALNVAKNYYYQQLAYNERWYNSSIPVAVPAFTFPKTAAAAYDPVAQKVTFSWTIDPVSGTNFINDKFKIQVANNANFTDAREVSYDYDPAQASFSYVVDNNLSPQMYFRVARAHTGFNWELAKQATTAVAFTTIPLTATAVLQNSKTAVLTWNPLATAWLPGSTFIITRINNTAKTQSEIRLNKADFDKGTYSDVQISTCNSYNYTLQVVPPVGSSFTAFAPVQIPNEILPTEIGSLVKLDVSKGYFPDRTELRWSTNGSFDNFIIKRAVYGTTNFVQMATVPGSTNSEYQTDDAKGTPGVYYTYQVIGAVKCNNTTVFSKETLAGVGFRSPTGNIYGRITYENGQAVQDVSVRLQSNDQVQLGKSVYLNGTANSYLQLDSTTAPFSDSSFTIEAWIKPDVTNPANQTIFYRNNQYALGFDAAGKLFFSYKGISATGTYSNAANIFVHVTGIHTKDSLFIMLNNTVIGKIAAPYSASVPDKKVYIGRGLTTQQFKGYIDEMRIYNIAISQANAIKNQTRLFSGDETGLAAYWRFDEAIKDQFYDLSFHGENYNRNNGTMSVADVTRSGIIPTADQLALKSYTDLSGNYFIAGIPYTGNGTTYTIVPLKGTHQFDPVSVNRLISPSSTQFTVDFKDKSSFAVSGFVYYKNSTVPVPGVQFKIDGQYAQQSNGTILETDENGRFSIFVPVGTHEVKTVKANHAFANDGKVTDKDGHNLNYQDNIAGLSLTDTTTIRFIGRVAGGAIQQDLPLGHSVSVNNLGKAVSITLLLPTGNKYSLNTSPTIRTVAVNHLLPSNVTDSSKIHKTKVTYNTNSIVITPDSLTGEFVADLIPVKFIASAVNVTGWGDILNGKPVLLDFIDKFSVQSSVRHYADSTLNSQNAYDTNNYFDSLTYNASYKFIKRVTPSVEILQQDNNGKGLPYFGNLDYESVSLTGQKENVVVVDTTGTVKAIYNFGNPVFIQNQQYTFGVKAFEQYPFYASVVNGVPVIQQVGGKNVLDNVPTSDGFVSVLNRIRNGTVAPDTFRLDDKGMAQYVFTAGDPSPATQGIKDLSTSIRFGEATTINWTWFGDPQLKGFVIGGKLTGTDFVTAGPDKVLMVLRDPPGSKSFSYAEKGSTITNSTTYSGKVDQVGDLDLTQKLGAELVTFTGFGVGVINSAVASTGASIGIHHEEHYSNTSTKESSTTLTTKFQTSDDPLFVGPVADVFIGYSTNITYGQSNNITIIKRTNLKASDILLFQSSPTSTYIVIQRAGINVGETFGTLFAFPQQHIEKVLIPNLINIRNIALLPLGTSLADAQSLADSKQKPVYISKLANDDTNFAKSNNDTTAFGPTAKTDAFDNGKSYRILFPAGSQYRTDTIMILNQYVANWEKRMADNEKAKLESSLIQNYSFHAGSPIEYSTTTTINETKENAFNFIIAYQGGNSSTVKINGIGMEFKYTESIGTDQGGSVGSSTETSTTLGFNLISEGTDDYFSIDLNKAADNSLVFHTKGGVSGCPYEAATISKYYQPGTLIDQPTQRIEVPVLIVDNPVVNDVPSSRKATYNLTLRNESEAKLPATFVIGYVDNDSIKGATIAVDGSPIGGAGRAVYLQYGESITKVLTITRGPNAMDYNNIQILLHSSCQYDPTGYRSNIADTVLVSAHFIPSCSDINIKSPKDKWVLNSESPVNAQGRRYLPIIVDQFDVTNSLFDHIELQYKPTSSSTWITAIKFYSDSVKMKAAQGEKQFITNASGIIYNFVMDDGSFNDQNYDVQAVSYCKVGAGFVTTESNLITGIKDTYNPRLFGTPQPADGVLSVNDDIRLNFNETIAAGLLTNSDFQVTGIRNGVKGDHAVSVKLDGASNYLGTEFEKCFTGKSITTEMWILPSKQADQTLFSHGSAIESLELSLTADNKMQITVGSTVIKSTSAYDYKPGEWAHVAMVYNDKSKTVSAFYNFVEMIHAAPVNPYTGTGHIEYGRSISKQNSYFSGKVHEARIWNDTLNSIKLQVNSLSMLSGAENSLLAYYPMNEGKGLVAFDKAHGSNAALNGLWSTPAGKAISLNGNGYAKLNTSFAPVLAAMDYTIELWFKGDATQSNSTLASNGKGDGTEFGGSLNLFNLGFESGLLTFQNNGFKIQATGNYLDNSWHHVAVAVNRNSGSAQLLVDGVLNQFSDAKNLGGIAAAVTYLGVRTWYSADATTVPKFDRYFKGYIDEFRIWNTYMNQTLISKNNNVRLMGNEFGLMAYYPFENYEMFQGNTSLYFSPKDLKVQEDVNAVVPDAVLVNAVASDEAAPMKDHGPVANLNFDFVVNNDALIINMQEPKQSIDKTVITFQSKNVRDMNGNKILSPVTWTAYIDQNQLKWSDKEINLVKEVNAPLSFESHLVNSGGSSQHFTLSNLPSWLKADPLTGTVDPKGNLTIDFTVNDGLNIGSYEEIIFMRNDNNETEALKLTLQVNGKKPNWVVKPGDYQYNMNVYGKIRLNNLFSISKGDMLAAFVNGKCVGVSNNTYNASSNLWYVYLTLFSNDLANNNVEFRIWQSSTSKTFRATPSTIVNFASNAIVGSPSLPVIFDGSSMLYQDMVVNENWNWVSFNLSIPVNTLVGTTLANGLWTSNDLIKNDLTGFSNYTSTGWTGSLKSLDNISLFKLKATNAQLLTLNGIPVNVSTTAIPLKGARWNYISYLPQVNATIKEALSGYKALDQDVIKSQTGFAMYSAQNGWIGSLNYLEPGKGYMLYRTRVNDTAFFYPSISGSLSGGRPITGGGIVNPDQRPVPGNFSNANNMTIIATVAADFDFRKGDSIIAYVNGELRGKAKPILNPEINKFSYFFNIGGESEQPLVFMVERGGSIIAQSSTIVNYNNNTIMGTLNRPLELHFVKQAGAVTVYPNPFNNTTNISINLSGLAANESHEIRLSVVDVTGRVILTKPVQKVSGTGYTTNWNGRNAGGMMSSAGVYFIHTMIDGVPHIDKVIKQ
ncbi:MAG: Pentaxin family [Ferruginibacter sp.]|uniref:LamG-like jellyroll fold domain-containing protein n=1 Tax=Ferruginibacter sp. TaxID=1940288 RepID=UPI0026582A8F|nr:LamG-like jellyroll fold domain-containing protein [Ferruginibacter sp.]MDB5279232.1 Pentaxin family [Ferruginibacter sp.]